MTTPQTAGARCRHAFEAATVHANGEVVCSIADGRGDFVLANVHERSIRDILSGARVRELRRLVLSTKVTTAGRERTRFAALLLLILLLLPGCGSPTSPEPTPSPDRWTGAQRIGGAPEPVPNCNVTEFPQVGMDGRGGAVAAWLSECAIWTARYVPGQGWTQPEAIGGLPAGAVANWLWEPVLAVNDIGSALVVWPTEVDVSEGRQLWARRRESSTGWQPPERIDGFQARQLPDFMPAVALDSAGNGLAVWISQGAVAARLVAGGGWMPPERISGPAAFVYESVAFDPLGRAYATWTEAGAAIVRRFDSVRGWGPVTRFAPQDGSTFVGAGRIAFDRSGRAVLVWERSLGYLRPSSVWSASLLNDAWTPFAQVSAAGADAGNPRVGLGSDGQGLAVWAELEGLRFAPFDFVRGWEAPGAIPAAASGPLDLSVNGSGLGMLVWSQRDASQVRDRVQGSRYVNGRWETTQALQATTNGSGPPVIAVDSCGNATAVWTEFEGERTRVWANRFDTGCR